MAPAAQITETVQNPCTDLSLRLAKGRSRYGEGRAKLHSVRINDTLQGLFEMAKPSEQSMPEFLRACAVEISLQRLEASQI